MGRANESEAGGDEGFGWRGRMEAREQADDCHDVSLDCASSGNDEGKGWGTMMALWHFGHWRGWTPVRMIMRSTHDRGRGLAVLEAEAMSSPASRTRERAVSRRPLTLLGA